MDMFKEFYKQKLNTSRMSIITLIPKLKDGSKIQQYRLPKIQHKLYTSRIGIITLIPILCINFSSRTELERLNIQ